MTSATQISNQLVSVVIPAYNAERWIKEAFGRGYLKWST